MPFQKGRQKTGGREKGAVMAARKSPKFSEQLSGHGFNYAKELADVLKQIRDLGNSPPNPIKAAELKYLYTELKSLLPYMAPKLREKEVEVVEPTETTVSESAVSTQDILEAINGKQTKTNPRTSDSNPLGTGRSELQVSSSTTEDSSDVGSEQEEI